MPQIFSATLVQISLPVISIWWQVAQILCVDVYESSLVVVFVDSRPSLPDLKQNVLQSKLCGELTVQFYNSCLKNIYLLSFSMNTYK